MPDPLLADSNKLFTSSPADAPALAARLANGELLVVGLCADWCGTCKEFRPALERIAATMPLVTFVWLDVEDDSALAGDIDIENFPSLAVFRDGQAMHYGVTDPLQGVVVRLLGALFENDRIVASVPRAVAALPAHLAHHAARASAH